MVNNKDNSCLHIRIIGLIVAPWKFDVLQTSILASKLRFSGKYLFYENQISVGQLSADCSLIETLYCLNRISTSQSIINFK